MDISVITPFYKGNAYMERFFSCIRSCCEAAPSLSVELLLVNDSPEHIIEYDENWIKGFTLRIITNEKNSGIHRSRINGIAAAEGKFLQFLDQDDLLAQETFATQFPLAQSADVVIANGFDQNPYNYGPIYKSLAHQKQATHSQFYYSVGNQIISPGHTLIRKDAIPKVWCTDTIRHNGSDDLLLWLMMFAEGARFTINPLHLYTHVDTGSNVSANIEKMLASSQEVLELLDSHGMVTPAQKRKFRRSRSLARHYVGKNNLQKLLTMALYPDVALARIALHHLKNT